ncbi:MAG TPA: tRNA (N(6)-L-threonylcarbamoyladenosine(37)-C(2))-methylthiotransferase MtaB [Candidatus Limnocylindrales bacterium]|nr:tRNA (N(6)-L-threonylcarbamoyladenosine(37)-C(2))-methylthiotransferase MtaB [Candidatus Limnocylindrales bacterium]
MIDRPAAPPSSPGARPSSPLLPGARPPTSAAPPSRSAGRRIRTAAVTNLGCKVNQSEVDAAVRLLRERGVVLVPDDQPVDLYLVNTCTVTAVADHKSRQAVRRARRANPAAELVVTGCSVQVDPAAFAALDPSARLIDNAAKDRLLAELDALAAIPSAAEGPLARPLPTLSGVEPLDGLPSLEAGAGGARAVPASPALDGVADDRTSADRHRAYVKVQDGCSFYCTYCIIPRARGPERSVPPEAVLADVRRALRAGHREIVLTGINIGTYDGGWSERGFRGAHTRSALTLAGLVRRILAETDVERIRLSSIEPQHVDDELLEAWVAGAPRTMPHFHLPLQSGDERVLRRMGRRYDPPFYARLVERIRSAIPGVAIHADVIVGFPTEDDAAFERSVAFVRSLEPAGLHVFRYSERPGTPAVRMAGRVDERTRKERAAVLLAEAARCRARFAARAVGGVRSVLFERRLDDGRWLGHAEDHVLVAARSPADGGSLENAIGRVRVEGVDADVPDRTEGVVESVEPARVARPWEFVVEAAPVAAGR